MFVKTTVKSACVDTAGHATFAAKNCEEAEILPLCLTNAVLLLPLIHICDASKRLTNMT